MYVWQRDGANRVGRAVVVLGAVGAVLGAGLAVAPTARANSDATIVGAGGRCVDVPWAQTANGTPIQVADCNGTIAQDWSHDGSGSVRALGKCLDVAGSVWADGTRIQLFDCNGTGAQQWRITDGQLVNAGSGKCLDTPGDADGTHLRLWTCTGSPTQRWSVPGAPRPAAGAGKKGVSAWAFPRVADGVRAVGAGWYYDWSADPADVPAPAEFVPMIWGAGAVDDDLDTARRSGTTLLGFNEPDLPQQANMSVEQALALWPRLERTGMRLGSPAVAAGADVPGGWLDRFLSGARERGMRVDFIALHWYGSDFGDAAPQHLMDYVQAVHERYGLPVWVTEFSLTNFTGHPRYPSAGQLTEFIRQATARLQAAPYVERYALFPLPASGDAAAIGLYREDGMLTPAGEAYRRS
ncbi:glycoside hydrolase family protein [Micromonospora sp. NPDC051300]|uniref:glycoside hydrolase family protein n=1 Tax=Micromonospora sp. NPDC051300 TaxID=3364286 RepID=UPI00379186E0